MPRSWSTHLFNDMTSAFGWLVCTFAAGAIAAFVGSVAGVRPCWVVLVLALPLTVILKLCGCTVRYWGVPVAALAVLLAGFYATCLVAIVRIATTTGFPFAQAFEVGGLGLTLQVAKLGLDALALGIYAAAAIAAAALATWLARPAKV